MAEIIVLSENKHIKLGQVPYREGISPELHLFRGNYEEVTKKFNEDGLVMMPSSELALLVNHIFKNPSESYSGDFLNILNENGFLESKGELYITPDNKEVAGGIIFETNPTIINRKLKMNKKDLIERLYNKDSSVKFAKREYNDEFRKAQKEFSTFIKIPYLLTRYGEEGIKSLAEVAFQQESKPLISGNSWPNHESRGISALTMARIGGNMFKGIHIHTADPSNPHLYAVGMKEAV